MINMSRGEALMTDIRLTLNVSVATVNTGFSLVTCVDNKKDAI